MATIASIATTFNLPNYGGPLYRVTPTETPFLAAIGGLSELGETADSPEFGWQTEGLRAPEQPEHLEGADAPAASSEDRQNFDNLCQIFFYTFGVTYTKQAARGMLSGVNNSQTNPVQDEVSHQAELKLITAARDMNYTFLRGAYQKPANAAQARKTRGLLTAITTNVADLASAALTKVAVLDLLQSVWNTAGINQDANPTLMCGATIKRGLTKLFITDAGYQEKTRDVGGVSLTTIECDFGIVNLMLERSMPATTLGFAHLGYCRPRFLVIPDKGFLFVEPLGKKGAQDTYQLYGEAGLEYGHEAQHAKLLNCGAVAGA
jgi:hypothetical protein